VGNDGIILATTDGHTWAREDRGAYSTDLLNGVSCGDRFHCVAVGGIFRSMTDVGTLETSDGSHWQYVKQSQYVGGLRSVSCPAVNDCFAVGVALYNSMGVIFHTSDGRTWTQQALPPNTGELWSVSCTDVKHCLAVGENGQAGSMLVTSDGDNWSALSYGANGPMFFGVSCPEAQLCYVVGSSGAIYVGAP